MQEVFPLQEHSHYLISIISLQWKLYSPLRGQLTLGFYPLIPADLSSPLVQPAHSFVRPHLEAGIAASGHPLAHLC